jgi:hypothetical protein
MVIRTDGDTTVLKEIGASPASAATLADYAGTYASDELDVKLVIAVKGDHLVLLRRPADEFTLRSNFDDDFQSPIGSLRFSPDAQGRVTGFGVYSGRIRDVRFRREGR